jgi:hypothetical protein
MNWEYVAGLWGHDIVVGLLWHHEIPDVSLATNASSHPGPSWSWASANKCMTHTKALFVHNRTWFESWQSLPRFKRKKKTLARCVEVRDWAMELAGEDQFAEVKSGQLSVFGNIRSITISELVKLTERSLWFSHDGSAADIIYYPDSKEPSGDSNATRSVWCLVSGFTAGSDSWCDCYVLALQPVPGRTATFKRIGFMKILCSGKNIPFVRSSYSQAEEMVDWLLASEPQQIYLV